MKSLSEFDIEARKKVDVVLTDIDDTLTEDGRLPASAYSALEALKTAGFIVAPITGRPAGWCDMIARQWPVDGVVGENGAFYFRFDPAERLMKRAYAKSLTDRTADRQKLDAIRERVLREVPGAAVAADQPYREADLAIDFKEDVPPLPAASIERIVQIFEDAGATAKISSIHVNGWFGGYDKLSTTRLMLKDCFDLDIDLENTRIVFAGDSPNDQPMFEFFQNSVGVANVMDFSKTIYAPPRYVTKGRCAAGFVELSELLLAARNQCAPDTI
ncbi:MAG: HAD family phosphatase [Rhizobiaceae bacterium]|nr:HAD family phosphatase [Rhizobiaceae bacterium]